MRKKHLLIVALCLLLSLSISTPGLAKAPEMPPPQDGTDAAYNVFLIPALITRMCVGDSYHFTFTTEYQEPFEPAPLVENDFEPAPLTPDSPPIAPLPVRHAQASSSLGNLSQSDFGVDEPFEAFSFEYTALAAGKETITVSMDGSNSDSFSFEIRNNCDYDLWFFAVASEVIQDQGGFMSVLSGKGTFGITRTQPEAGVVSGKGTEEMILGLVAFVPEAFSCAVDPVNGSGSFTIEGAMLAPPANLLHINLLFDAMRMPGEMVFNCEAAGMQGVQFRIPVDPGRGDLNELSLTQMLFAPEGGTVEFSGSNYEGLLFVKEKR